MLSMTVALPTQLGSQAVIAAPRPSPHATRHADVADPALPRRPAVSGAHYAYHLSSPDRYRAAQQQPALSPWRRTQRGRLVKPMPPRTVPIDVVLSCLDRLTAQRRTSEARQAPSTCHVRSTLLEDAGTARLSAKRQG